MGVVPTEATAVMPAQRDYYEILGVERTATVDEIKRAYRKCAMKYHPDRNPGDAEAEAKFKECAEAMEVLGDAERRQRYDRFGHEGVRGQGMHDFGGMSAADIFSMFEDAFGDLGLDGIFGGRGGGGARAGVRRGYDLETTIEIELADVLSGTTQTVEFTREDLCETCSGSGAKPGTQPAVCATCGGQGKVAVRNGFFQMVRPCPDCGGAGRIVKDKCPECRGSGRRPKSRKLDVKVPAGIHDGQIIRVPGEGEPGSQGGPQGDLHVVVRVNSHKLFNRHNDDLVLHMPISFTQAALGAKLQVPTLEGRSELVLKPATQHGQTYTISKQGLPNLRSGSRGDLIVQVMVEIPKKLTEKQEALLREFALTENHEVLPHSTGFWDKIKNYLSGDAP